MSQGLRLNVFHVFLVYLGLCHAQNQWQSNPRGHVINRQQTQKQRESTKNSGVQRKTSRTEESQTNKPSSQRCQLETPDRIQCGDSEITGSECEAINCCFDGRQCYYGLAVTLQCTSDGQFTVVVAKDATEPPLNLDSISLAERTGPECDSASTASTFAIFHFPVGSCGTSFSKEEEADFIVYENTMFSSYEVGMGPHGSITRDSSYELSFQCRYSSSAVKAVVVETNELPPPPPIAQEGPMAVELRLASGGCTHEGCTDDDAYSSYYTEHDYPVSKVLREPVYVEVRLLDRTDPNLVLTLDYCWATAEPDAYSLPQWDLLHDGCPYKEDHYLTTIIPVDSNSGLEYPTHHKRFAVKMFTFVDQEYLLPTQQMVFIHCSTSICYSSDHQSCQQSCNRKRRALDMVKEYSGRVVSSGQVVIYIEGLTKLNSTQFNSTQLNGHLFSQQEGDQHVSEMLSYGLLSVITMAIFGISILGAVHLWRRKPRLQTVHV